MYLAGQLPANHVTQGGPAEAMRVFVLRNKLFYGHMGCIETMTTVVTHSPSSLPTCMLGHSSTCFTDVCFEGSSG